MEVSEDIQRLLKATVEHFDKEDTSVRERQIRTWRRLKLFWEGFQKTWYSEVAHDWRIYDDMNESDSSQSYYDKPVNVFRAYLESIMAALSVTVPPIKCFPDDAENTLDISTAKAGDKISELIYRHNDVSLLWLHALFIYCTEGMVACYSYPRASDEYGTYTEKKYEESEEQQQSTVCPQCGFTLNETTNSDEFLPDELDTNETASIGVQGDNSPNSSSSGMNEMNSPNEVCPACGQMMTPEVKQETLVVTRLIGEIQQPKSRVCLEAYGGLYVKIANYAKTQKDTPYLGFSYETHYANAIERFSHLHGKQKEFTKRISTSVGPRDPYEQWGRLSSQYQGEYPTNNVTIRNFWLRPAAFNIHEEDETRKLKKKFPKGVKVVLVNDEFGEAQAESLDDHWTLTYNPLSDFLHHDPIGMLLVSIQEITNDLLSLVLQTIEHGIGQTFADPGVLNFPAYRNMEAIPGGIYEAIPKSGRSVGDAFYEVKTATLSPEVMPFAQNIQSLAQLVSGALPSLFGGVLQGAETASQYSMSRAQALQRLQNVWKIFTIWWKQIFGKSIPMFIKLVKDDERDVKRNKDGSFINVFIRKAELEGKIGKVELEANENLPLTWSQIKDVVEKLLQINSPEILSILGAPENLPAIRESLGLINFYVPGEDSVEKQYDEIKLLLNSEPIPSMDGNEAPSVEVDQVFDVHPIEFEIVRKWITSEAGRQAKIDNPNGYKNVLLHGKMHQMFMMPPQQSGPSGPPSEKPNQLELQNTPIQGEGNVSTIQ